VTAQLKNFFTIVLKNAVNALLTSSAMMTILPGVFHFHDHNGLVNIAKLAGSTVLAREIAVWGPELLRWSATSASPSAMRTSTGGLDIPPPKGSTDAPKP